MLVQFIRRKHESINDLYIDEFHLVLGMLVTAEMLVTANKSVLCISSVYKAQVYVPFLLLNETVLYSIQSPIILTL